MSDELDLAYHDRCKRAMPEGWQLYGSSFGSGCSAVVNGRQLEIEEPLLEKLEELAVLTEPGELTDERILKVWDSVVARRPEQTFRHDVVEAVRRCLAIDRSRRDRDGS